MKLRFRKRAEPETSQIVCFVPIDLQEIVKDKLEEFASQSCDSQVASTLDKVLSLVVGQRSGYVRGRGCGPKPPSKSAVTTATIVGLQAQVKDKDERIS
ncbi:hypothetical protein Taro_032253 [Colocasia esculenta]|uniref:Uncharacterized protein n=1 Tax=Colocasia esculenta TaxID=4460 RepID=A0A843W1F4_COLES|nr:hypothetical protein [Colocasia esculenta]